MIEKLKPYPAYKDSGVEWLGKVPAHWEVRAIRHITSPVKGKQPKALYSKDEAPAGAQPYLTMQYMRGHKGTAKALYSLSDGLVTARKGDVLLLWDGANAGEFFLAKDGVVPSTAALLATDKHDRHYLYFMLKQCEPWLRAFSTGMGIPHVDGSFLKQMQIALPPPLRTNRHRPLPRLHGPAHPALHPRQAAADQAAGGVQAGPHPPSRHRAD